MHANHDEIVWASGLFEGEGSIARPNAENCGLQLGMTDEDSVRRFHRAVLGIGVVDGPYGPYGSEPNRKPIWRWRATHFEDVQAVIAMLWNGFGGRRRAAARALLLYKQAARPRGRNKERRKQWSGK